MNRNLTFTLAYNLVSEVADSIERLYAQNKNFEHLIVDVSFPLTEDKIPDDIEKAKEFNTGQLIDLADDYGCDYLKIANKGVSQNYNTIIDYLQPDETDIICAVDPDEVAIENNWVEALCEVLRADELLGYAAPILIDAIPLLRNNAMAELRKTGGHWAYHMKGQMNYGFLAIHGRFLKIIGNIPVPTTMKIYGGLEAELAAKAKEHSVRWCILKDKTQGHTNNCKLYRAWKNEIIFGGNGQYSFEEWLIKQKVEV